ncbi:hypothetical protein BJX62DRAFT_236704 [Aspergillus germanicus]
MRTRDHYDYDYLDYEEEDANEYECKRAEWPSQLDKSWVKKTTIAVVYATMAAGAIHLLAIIGIVISIFVKDNTPIDEDFALYNNTRFEECATMIPDAASCNAIRNIKVDYLEGIDRYIRWSVLGYQSQKFDWCEAISCFNGFKVIPSTSNDGAMGVTSLGGWWYFVTTALGVLWASRTSCPIFHRRSRTAPETCQGVRDISVIDWIILIYGVCGPMAWWWVSFFSLLANPEPRPTLSASAWIITWKYSYLVQIHPFSCILTRLSRKLQKAVPWILGLLAVPQWAATLSPTASCTAAELCAKDWLFSASQPFLMPGEMVSAGATIGLWQFGTGFCVIYLQFGLLGIPGGQPRGPAQGWAAHRWAVFKMAGIGELGWSARKPDALVAVDYECRAVHVSLSPWRCYLDFAYARALRTAKM